MSWRACPLPFAFVLALVASSSAQSLPPDFESVPLSGSFSRPNGLVISDDGLFFVIEQSGRVRIHDGQSRQAPSFLDLSDEVNHDHDRGLLGVALHPGFQPDGGPTSWVYFLYTVSPVFGQDMDYDENDQYSFSRLTRYRAITSGPFVLADTSSRQILLGNQLPDGSVPDCIASLHNSHSNGSLHFADDGSLLVATGDGAHYDFTDTGGADDEGFDDWVHPVTGLRGPTPADQDSGAFRAQDLRSLAGKVLRIDPATGNGYPSNPFYDGDVTSNASRVWVLGLRNPFRTLVFPGTGASDPALGQPNVIAIGDVGYNTWEELSICTGGENLGWPCFEGFNSLFAYQSFNPGSPQFPNCNTAMSGTRTDPIAAWHHFLPGNYKPPGTYVAEDGSPLPGFIGAAAIGGTVYTGGTYPDLYDGRIFFGDYGPGFIKTIEVDGNYDLVAIRPFAANLGQIVAVERHPVTGDLYYVRVNAGRIYQIRYNDPDAVQVYGCDVNPGGSLTASNVDAYPGGSVDFALHNPLGTQSPGALTLLGVGAAPDPAFPCGTVVPGYGMGGPLAGGEFLLDLTPGVPLGTTSGPAWQGSPATVPMPIPFLLTLAGATAYVQGVIIDPTAGGGSGAIFGLTEAIELAIGS